MTHGHGDHTAGCKAIPGATVYAMAADVDLVGDAAKKLKSDGKGGTTIDQTQGSDYIYHAMRSGNGEGDGGIGVYVDPSGNLRCYGASHYQGSGPTTVWITEH